MGKLLDDIVSYRVGTVLRSKTFLFFNERGKNRLKSAATGTPEDLSTIRLFSGPEEMIRSW